MADKLHTALEPTEHGYRLVFRVELGDASRAVAGCLSAFVAAPGAVLPFRQPVELHVGRTCQLDVFGEADRLTVDLYYSRRWLTRITFNLNPKEVLPNDPTQTGQTRIL